MWPYNQEEHPPAPFLEVVVYHPTIEMQSVSTQAKIDTGADISAVPVTLVTQLGLPTISKLIIQGYDGIPTTASTFNAIIQIAQTRFSSQEFIAIPESYVLLGRGILNHFYVHLNGPDLTLELSLTPI